MRPAPQRHIHREELRQNLKNQRHPDSIETPLTNQSQIASKTPFKISIKTRFYLSYQVKTGT